MCTIITFCLMTSDFKEACLFSLLPLIGSHIFLPDYTIIEQLDLKEKYFLFMRININVKNRETNKVHLVYIF